MAAELQYTPVHPETGLVLPVFITPDDFAIFKNRQHHAEHPATREELQDYAGQALRYSRTQQLPNNFHMGSHAGSYHDIFWGPEFTPSDKHGKIRKALLYIAGVIPRDAIYLTGDGYKERRLNNDEHAFLSHSSITQIEGNTPRTRQYRQHYIGRAIVQYALGQEISDLVSTKEKTDFLRTVDWVRERELGNQIIQRAVNEAIKPALFLYEEAKAEGMIDPRKLPLHAIVRNLVPKDEFGNYYEVLREKILGPEILESQTLQTEVDEVELAA